MQVNTIELGRAVSVEVECYGSVERNPDRYSVKHDGSLRSGGIEVVYTTARNGEPVSIPDLDVVRNCTVDRTCGLHVHIDVRDLGAREAGIVYRNLLRVQSMLKHLVPQSRLSNRYCRWRSNLHTRNRYAAINFLAYYKFRTIEFRCQSGSTERAKIEAWAELCWQLVQWARTAPEGSALQWNRFLEILSPEIRRWAIERRVKLHEGREYRDAVRRALDGETEGFTPSERRVLRQVGLLARRERAPRQSVQRGPRQRWIGGYSVSSVLRRMGQIGLTSEEALAAAERDQIEVQPSTVAFMVSAGQQGSGTIAPIGRITLLRAIGLEERVAEELPF